MQSSMPVVFRNESRLRKAALDLHKGKTEPVIRQILLLVLLFFAALAAIALGHHITKTRLAAVASLQKNEQSRLEMTYLTHIELQQIQALFQNMFLSKTDIELAYINKQILNSLRKVDHLVSVMEKGGTMTYDYKVNFRNKEEIQQSFHYRLSPDRRIGGIDMGVFELKNKIRDIVKHREAIEKLISEKINRTGTMPQDERDRKILLLHKGIDPYFQRIFEISYRNYFSAQSEMQRLTNLGKKTEQSYMARFYLAIAIVGLFVIVLATLMLLNISRILRERSAIQDELRTTNENLEQRVEERTQNLLAETKERLRAEEEAKQRADFLKTTIDSLAHPFYVIDVETYEIEMLNEYARQLNPAQTRYCFTLTHNRTSPCSGEDHPCPLAQVRQSKKPVTMEHIHQNRDGNTVLVEVHGHPVFDSAGRLSRMIEYSLDVTKKKLAEIALEKTNENLEQTVRERTAALEDEIERRQEMQAKLQDSEHYWRTLIESSNDLMIILSLRGDIIYASPAAETVLGYSPEQWAGKSLYDYLHPEDARFVKENFGLFIGSLQPGARLKHRVRAADGSYRVLESSFRNLSADRSIGGILVTARDVTARHEAEILMKKLQLVVEQSPNSIVITNKNGDIEYVNPQFEKVSGYSSKEALGQNPRILKSDITPAEKHRELWKTITAGNIWRGEFANRNKAGEIYYENVVIVPLKNEPGEITHFVAIKENITELKKAYEQVETSSKAKSQFLSRMSHELRTPLNAINGFSRLLMESAAPPLDKRQLEYARQINAAGYHLLELINEILDLSRIESGRMSLSLETIKPTEAVKSCLGLVESLLFDKKVTLHLDDSVNSLPAITADTTRFKQIILNLLTNAIKYNRPGGTVTISAAVENNTAIIKVADTGIGIPLEKQQSVFTPFERLGQEHRAIEGTGIGLAITRQLMELMQGTIGFESTPGQGSAFWVAFPLAEQNGPPETDSPGGTGYDNVQKDDVSSEAVILYVEDDAVNILLMREIISRWPRYSLVVKKTAEKGIQAARLLKPDIILMDLTLPTMSGIDALISLRQDPDTRNIPVIALSADYEPQTVQKCRDLGFYDYLFKPVDMSILQDVLAAALKGKKNDRRKRT